MENKELPPEIITKENLPQILALIGSRRETKGTSEMLIPYIRKVRASAEQLGENSIVLQLYQEEFLSAQHMVMEEKSKGLRGNPFRFGRGIILMESVSKTMESYRNGHSDVLNPVVNARVYRFLGRYADYKKQFVKSEEMYRKGLAYFDSAASVEERYNRLEFNGFLAYSFLNQDKTNEGISLVNKTLSEFDESAEGVWLKEHDYFTWAVWKSGIEIRTAEFLAKSKENKSGEPAGSLLADAERILIMPDGEKEIFRLRLDELKSAKALLRER